MWRFDSATRAARAAGRGASQGFHGRDRAPEMRPRRPGPVSRSRDHRTATWRKGRHVMSESLTYQGARAPARDQAHTLFAQTMGYVAATAALFALGAYLGRNLGGGVGIVAFIAAFASLIGMQFAVRRSQRLAVGLLGAFGLLVGLALAPVLAAYASMDPQALWQAGGATALFITAFGAAGYATLRNLTAVARASFWALLALIAFGIVLIFVNIPGGALIYSVLGL